MPLTEELEALAYDVAFSLVDETPDLAESLAQSRDAARKLRALAVVVLLTRADVQRFQANLRHAAGLRLAYLKAAAQAGDLQAAGREYAAGRSAGLFDALAGGDIALAREIARLSPHDWRSDCEYEDDFLYAQFLHAHLLGAQWPGPTMPSILERFEHSLEGAGSARLIVCRALLAGDAAMFAGAFDELLQEQRRELASRRELGALDDPVVEIGRAHV